MTATFQDIDIALLQPSPTNPRKRFDEAKLAELADSIKANGIMQPVLVRAWSRTPPSGMTIADSLARFEIVAGERRWRAARLAGLPALPAIVRELSDQQVEEMQVVENLQREDLHPIEEAEGYDNLMKHHGYSADDVAAKVGKSRAYVYARLKLADLCDSARKAFFEGAINPSTALLIARIPVAKLQSQAVKEITQPRSGGETMSVRDAAQHIQAYYMLRLSEARFPRDDASLVPSAGACAACPKRTGAQPVLFEDVAADTCTDPTCFDAKRRAHADILIREARERGQKVLEGKAAKEAMPYAGRVTDQFVRLDEKCYDVPTGSKKATPTWRDALGGEVETLIVRDPHTGDAVEVARRAAARKQIAGSGGNGGTPAVDKARQKADREHKIEAAWRLRLFLAIREHLGRTLANTDGMPTPDEVRLIGLTLCRLIDHDSACRLAKARAGDVKLSGDEIAHSARTLRSLIDQATADDDIGAVTALAVELCLAGELGVHTYGMAAPERMLATAARFGIDGPALRKDIAAEIRAAEKAKARPKAAKTPGKTAAKTASPPTEAAQAAALDAKPAPGAGRRRKAKAAAGAPQEEQEPAPAPPAEGATPAEAPAPARKTRPAKRPAQSETTAPAEPANAKPAASADPLYDDAKHVAGSLRTLTAEKLVAHMQIGLGRARELITAMESEGFLIAGDDGQHRTRATVAWPFPRGA